MRRTQAGTLIDGSLADHPCRVCSAVGVTIIAIRNDERGEHHFAWCGPDCARQQGWPFLRSERGALDQPEVLRVMQADLFAAPSRNEAAHPALRASGPLPGMGSSKLPAAPCEWQGPAQRAHFGEAL